ncbi:MAG TPA: HAMP domain-containing sensor histidine kinase, partial [Acidimicrobiales bacterium]|nr:HAMP domain-containing sensor histidine kinase [Acidimicrobiales bacterium]
MTLRLRLLLVLVGIVAAGLLLADTAIYVSLRSYLYDQVDTELQQDAGPIAAQLTSPLDRPFRFGAPGQAYGPPDLWVALRDPSGDTQDPQSYPLAPPQLPLRLPGSGSASQSAVYFTARSAGSDPVTYRVFAQTIQLSEYSTIVLAIPLDDLNHTLGELLLIEGLVSAGVLVGLGALAWWIVRHNLRPLDQMTATAGAIAGGDLSRRIDIDEADEHTEVGQLGAALNTMLTGIEEAFAARAASEERLRLFLADASHELRTPLTSIRGYAELFDRGARDRPEDLATSMRHIREEANRMSVLVDELLLLARLDRRRPLAMEELDLDDIVTLAVDAARVSSPDRRFALASAGPLAVTGDALRLRQVVDNLLANAVQHTPPGSPVAVRLGAAGGWVHLEVEDRGPGVPAEEQARIFEPFHRSDPTRARATGGAGLGLTIVSAIAHAHGGEVGVVSPAPGAGPDHPGSVFWVRLPPATTAGGSGSPTDEGAARVGEEAGPGPAPGEGAGHHNGAAASAPG